MKKPKIVITEETANLVALSDEPIIIDKDARILALEVEVEELNDEQARLTAAADEEIRDHNETTKARNAAERFLVQMFDIWATSPGLSIENLDLEEEVDLRAAIVAAKARIAADEAFMAARLKAEAAIV